MSDRKPIPKSIRFEVFKRDSFTCQYCGAKAPDVVLNVDHIHPVADGGESDILNLITSCFSCNSGKSDRLLDDKSVIEKQRKQLDELNERRFQLEMIVEWRQDMSSVAEKSLGAVINAIVAIGKYAPNEKGEADIAKWLRKYGLKDVLDAVDKSFDQYIKVGKGGDVVSESWNKAFAMVPRIIEVQKKGGLSPVMARIFYVRGILRNRLSYINEKTLVSDLKEAVDLGVDVEDMVDLAKMCSSWSAFWMAVNTRITKISEEGGE